jgi:hypothetical protein
MVPLDYNSPEEMLHHLKHLVGLAGIDGDFVVPMRHIPQQTAKPICNQVVHVDMS